MLTGDVNRKIRDDSIMILDAANAWDTTRDADWFAKRAHMEKIMQDPEDAAELVEKLADIMDTGAVADLFPDEYIQNTMELQEARVVAGEFKMYPKTTNRKRGTPAEEAPETIESYSKDDTPESLTEAIKLAADLLKGSGVTVMGYKTVQEISGGDVDKLTKKLSDATGSTVTITKKKPISKIIKNRVCHFNRRAWLIEPPLPVYLITTDRWGKGNAGVGVDSAV